MPAEFPHNTLVIPASLQGDQMILTEPRLIELARAAAVFLTSDPKHQLPNPSQMTELLQRFNETGAVDSLVSDNHSADRLDSLVTNQQSSDDHDHPAMGSTFLMGRSYDQNYNEEPCEIAMTNGLGAHIGEQSEVEGPASSPFIATPAQLSSNTPATATATSDVNRGFFGSMKSMLTSPMKKIGLLSDTPRGSTTAASVSMAESTPTNGARMSDVTPTADARFAGHTPATNARFGITPSTDIDFSPTGLRDPKSPTPFNKRARHQRRVNNQKSSILKSQKSKAQRMQDELDGDDIHREEREKRRVGFSTRDEVRVFQPDESSQLSPEPPMSPRDPITGEPIRGTYSVPQTIPDGMVFSDEEDSSLQDTSMHDISQDDGFQNIDSHTDESIAIDPHSNDSRHHGSQKRRHDGSRILDSHYDESSTSQTLGSHNNTSQNGGPQFDGSRSKNSHHDESTAIDSQTFGSPAPTPSYQYKKCTDPYTGTMFRQPDWVQANLEAGRPPLFIPQGMVQTAFGLAPRSAVFGPAPPLFGSSGFKNLDEALNLLKETDSAVTEPTTEATTEPAAEPTAEATGEAVSVAAEPIVPVRANTGSYRFPDIDYGSEEEDEEEEQAEPTNDLAEKQNEEPTNVLAEKQNEQAVPAPPRPANAVLPPPYDKYVPKKASFLSFTENMSPMQVVVEKENENGLDPWEAADAAPSPKPLAGGDGSEGVEVEDEIMRTMSRRVLTYVDSIDDEEIAAALAAVAR